MREVIDAKLKHKPLPREAEPHRVKVINLTDALRRSLSEKAGGSHGRATTKKRVRAAQGKGPKLVESAGRRRRTA